MPRKPPKPNLRLVQKHEPLTIVERFISSWKTIGTLIFIIASAGFAYGKLATRAELEPVKDHIAAHDAELLRMGQAVSDTQKTVHQILEEVLKRK